jgi:hypothetical protein
VSVLFTSGLPIRVPLHTLNCTAFAIASEGKPRTPDKKASRRVNLCAAAASIITNASTCFASSGHSIPAAPALRIPACGAMVGGKFNQRGAASDR